MNSIDTAILLNILGFSAGMALYGTLLVMVLQHRKEKVGIDLLLVLTSILGLLWNVGELFSFIWRDFAANPSPTVLVAIAYSALGFLPSVVVHSAEDKNHSSRIITIAAYLLSSFAAFLHLLNAFIGEEVPSHLALRILTFGSIFILIGLLLFNYKQRLENKAIWIGALAVFAFSALHLSSDKEGANWFIELVAHQTSLPLVLVILIQHYRFAFADLFLKRALSLLFITLTAFALYVFVALPLGSLHEAHQNNDALYVGANLLLWIATALAYPFVHKFSVWLVDKKLLKRISFEDLLREIPAEIERCETEQDVLEKVSEKLGNVLTAKRFVWVEMKDSDKKVSLPMVNVGVDETDIFVPTSEEPFFEILLGEFRGGRRLLSEELQMLESVALLTARKIDSQRVVNERFEREIREQEYAKLATQAELSALRSQVNPHFLFNALTTIGYLIQTTPEKAFETLMKLTRLLRQVLKDQGEFTSLGEELAVVRNYLEIEKARFEERLKFEFEVPEDLQNIKIPSFILQPLVENSVKHAISVNKKGGVVKISASLKENSGSKILCLTVYDSGSGRQDVNWSNSNGIGLENIKGRLEAYYGKEANLKFETDFSSGSRVDILIPTDLVETR